ncbi:50S ribosomal protein L4 [Candidatus Desantisbacteria bacterium CG2_30_40_21]|uniref:Large ribosomal subunit protein uL4 n=5 Tax=unclassified Candidatus Desantisiibacteriota TaxID=3106372 RepID=A0A2M7JF31_9BACT|nr:ribosomal protein L4 [uncultured bacterium]OIP43540.1 MAG: 50S ribosomal protein L4 [Candidatus Desantisbacteria bacterium CG2_30_40_21]PIP39398.1 MAG: 50S ribosomal protein L4 [Candidatus Desantisbacteria bacterium CG23_combo_of_CG06-09_8_20_14_all_40_23]PIX17986.1 MAG: 50S ribosomal protein L4 [Candidatus Desantisbacteria bacterium CG_4_8_14_3_um_filter_40_12]PIY19570.1 MAG: 50S ribosomal protein L4 [Candidatus Desantisbacteria bacterium CG_4_10_14_3_um_filter_40_18]PJB30217.1 MAG: 50S ri
MPKVDLYNVEGEVIGEIELPCAIFGHKGSKAVVYEAIKAHRNNCRQGTASAKTRGEVIGGGKKPFKQKGTGNARQGSSRSPVLRGGGVVFPPKPRDYSIKLSPKVRRAALYTVLSDKVREGNLRVVDSLSLDNLKTSRMVQIFNKLKLNKPLLVLGERDENVLLSTRNIPYTNCLKFENLYAYEVLRHPMMLITRDAIDRLSKVDEVVNHV